ncbi:MULTISPECIES: acyl-CoA thioesterase [Ottowia]|jgi:thioesterase superfamily protein|uniref:Thioesterase family protein n=1 Tax=Ottowia cancrivicina TaxID=3040346 RepID=A0AAW6RM33_9BURK|nr:MULTISPECIES: thioesterase family protein [Ottowia]AKU66347.1 thioesterase [Ottowia sp. oral taxon 894]MDG9699877.1 thioesterase family protein [Ottowia sp. 10c7w1]
MRIELPDLSQRQPMHESLIAIRWGDMDALGHVNNSVYLQYMDVARVDWLHKIGCPVDPRGFGPVVINAFCNFHRQFEYPGQVLLKMYAGESGRSSFETWVTMEKAEKPGEICASGGATIIWVDRQAQKSAPLPDWLRALLS